MTAAAPGVGIVFSGDLRRIEARPGDAFVLKVRHALSMEQAAQLRAIWAEAMPGARVLVLDCDTDLAIIGGAEEKCGSSV